jgi:predicted PurR-regulated permease PerM
MAGARYDLTRITLAILFIAALLGASFWILRPFLPAVIWAATLVIATWPIMIQVQARLWNSRALAVTIMTLTLLLVFVVPFWFAIGTIVRNSDQIVRWTEFVASMQVPPPPSWLGDLPLIGPKAVELWQKIGDVGFQELLQRIRPYAAMITQWFIAAVGSFGMVLVQFLLTVAMSAVMYVSGERAAASVRRFGHRLAGERGVQSVQLAAHAIRGVALGVVVTALVQAAVGGVGLVIAGVPFAPVLCAVMFMLCIAQMGPALVLVPAVIWMYANSDPVWATVLLIFSVLAVSLDNVLRPILIRKGANLPLLLVLSGVIGGLIAFGLIGIFIGPTVLAVSYTLLQAWIAEDDDPDAASTPQSGMTSP